MIYKTIEEWIERNPNHIGMLPIEVCHQIWGTKKKEWVGLTQNDIYKISEKCGLMDAAWEDDMHAVEATLKDKNT